jgi:hypothetical protein
MQFGFPLTAAVHRATQRKNQCRAERALDDGAGDERPDPDEPGLGDAEFHPNANQTNPPARIMAWPSIITPNSGNADLSQPRSQSTPVMNAPAMKATRYPAVGPRPTQGPGEYRQPGGTFGEIGNDSRNAETRAIDRADHQDDQRLQGHGH